MSKVDHLELVWNEDMRNLEFGEPEDYSDDPKFQEAWDEHWNSLMSDVTADEAADLIDEEDEIYWEYMISYAIKRDQGEL